MNPLLTIPWHPSVVPATIPWRPRTRNALTRLGIIDDTDALTQLTANDLLNADHVGPVTVEDFATTLHAQFEGTIDGRTVTRHEVLDEAELRWMGEGQRGACPS